MSPFSVRVQLSAHATLRANNTSTSYSFEYMNIFSEIFLSIKEISSFFDISNADVVVLCVFFAIYVYVVVLEDNAGIIAIAENNMYLIVSNITNSVLRVVHRCL